MPPPRGRSRDAGPPDAGPPRTPGSCQSPALRAADYYEHGPHIATDASGEPALYRAVMSDQLTALDATFLELEQMDEGATMHIGGVMVFDAVPGGAVPSLAAVRTDIASRLTLLPRYRERLSSERTGGLNWP